MILLTNVSETQKVKGLRFLLASLSPPFSGKAPEFNQARFVWMQFQSELTYTLLECRQELLGFGPVLET